MLVNVLKIFALFLLSLDWCKCGSPDNQGSCQNGLSVTFAPPNVNNPYAFNDIPRTSEDAKNQKWTKSGNGCEDGSLLYKGTRYLNGTDYGIMILYDKNGYVAGLQTAIPKDKADNNGVIKYSENKVAYTESINGVEHVVFTVYLINPRRVCEGRSKEEFNKETIKRLYIRNGPKNYTEVSTVENKPELAADGWTLGKCVPGMGMHYYGDVANCIDLRPVFLLFDYTKKNELIGLGFVFLGNYDSSYRYEHPPIPAIEGSLELPPCFNATYEKAGGVTSLHIYSDPKPRDIKCPK